MPVSTPPRGHSPLRSRIGRGAGRALRSLTTPLLPEDYLELLAPTVFGAGLRGRIVHRRPETPDATTLLIRLGHGWSPHRPGQYVRLGVDIDGVRHWRAYSLTSTPDSRIVAVTVTRVRGGAVSEFLVDRAEPGLLVHLEAACGEFTLPAQVPTHTLFITAGSGITPVMGILRSHADDLKDVVVVHSARRPEDVVFGGELRQMATDGRIRLVERHTSTRPRFTPSELDALVPDWRERHTWACGPVDLLDALASHWAADGSSDLLRIETFRPQVAATVGDADGGRVTFADSGVVVDSDGTAPLLDTGEDAGVLMPSGCRMGICHGCVVPLVSGSVRDLRDGTITTATDEDDVRIQTCISAPVGPCTLTL